jgi:hypothetical protein
MEINIYYYARQPEAVKQASRERRFGRSKGMAYYVIQCSSSNDVLVKIIDRNDESQRGKHHIIAKFILDYLTTVHIHQFIGKFQTQLNIMLSYIVHRGYCSILIVNLLPS